MRWLVNLDSNMCDITYNMWMHDLRYKNYLPRQNGKYVNERDESRARWSFDYGMDDYQILRDDSFQITERDIPSTGCLNAMSVDRCARESGLRPTSSHVRMVWSRCACQVRLLSAQVFNYV